MNLIPVADADAEVWLAKPRAGQAIGFWQQGNVGFSLDAGPEIMMSDAGSLTIDKYQSESLHAEPARLVGIKAAAIDKYLVGSTAILILGQGPAVSLSDQITIRSRIPGQESTTDQIRTRSGGFADDADSFRVHSLFWHGQAELQPREPLQTVADLDVSGEFQRLADEWRENTMMLSSLTAIALDKSYQRIIGLGPPAVPLILHELQERPGHWFWALVSITGEDPAGVAADFEAARQAWLEWGRIRGLIR